MLKVSVITPTWKRPKGLKRAIDCVAAQTYKNIEHIVIHDGRESLNYAGKGFKFKNDKVHEFCLDENHDDVGITPLNEGIRAATGDVFIVLADDNEIAPEHVEELVKLFEKDENLGFSFSFGVVKDHVTQKVVCPLNAQTPAYEMIDLGQLMIRKSVDERLGPWVYDSRSYDWWRVDRMIKARVPYRTNMRPTFCFWTNYSE